MRKYELMVIFPIEEEPGKAGAEGVKAALSEFGAEIEKEEPYGDRDLCYEIKKQRRGRYTLFVVKANPSKIVDIQNRLKLNKDVLKYLFVKIDD